MTRLARDGEWVQAGTPVKGARGWLLAAYAVLFHVFSFAWLRAPSWRDKGEARRELARVVKEHDGQGYTYWARLIGQRKPIEFTSGSGIWYQGSVEPVWDDRPGGRIRILISLDDGGVGAFHPLTDSLLVEPQDGQRDA